MGCEMFRDLLGICRCHAQAGIKCAHASQQQPRLERSKHAALLHAQPFELLPPRVLFARHERAGDNIGMPVQIFGRGMHDEIGAKLQRPREYRRRDR